VKVTHARTSSLAFGHFSLSPRKHSAMRCTTALRTKSPWMDDFPHLAMPEAYVPHIRSKLIRSGPGTHYTSTCTSMPFFAGAAFHACIIIHLHVFLSVKTLQKNLKNHKKPSRRPAQNPCRDSLSGLPADNLEPDSSKFIADSQMLPIRGHPPQLHPTMQSTLPRIVVSQPFTVDPFGGDESDHVLPQIVATQAYRTRAREHVAGVAAAHAAASLVVRFQDPHPIHTPHPHLRTSGSFPRPTPYTYPTPPSSN
jgi:hypothetical protein